MNFDKFIKTAMMIICLAGAYGLVQTFYFMITAYMKPTFSQSIITFGIMFLFGGLLWILAKGKE